MPSDGRTFQDLVSPKEAAPPVSLEVLPSHGDQIPSIAQNFPKGTKVYITFLGIKSMDKQIETAKIIRRFGLEPVPHIAARRFVSEEQLDHHLQRLASEAQVTEVLAVGGDPKEAGAYDSTLALLQTGLLEKHCIKRVGLAGHPEGNKHTAHTHTASDLMGALREKQEYLQTHGMEGYIATQFLFNSEPLIDWAKQLRENGITLPVHVGIPGPNDPAKLLKYAIDCGVGKSLAFARTDTTGALKLFTRGVTSLLPESMRPAAATEGPGKIPEKPNRLVDDLTAAMESQPELGIAGIHFYPFGNYDGLVKWMQQEKPHLLGGGLGR